MFIYKNLYVYNTYRVDSLSLAGIAVVPKYMPHVASAVIAAHFSVVPDAYVGFVACVETFVICVPTIILKLRPVAVQRIVASSARKVTRFRKEGAKLALPMPFGSSLTEYPKLVPCQFLPPLLVRKLKGVLTHVDGIHTSTLSHPLVKNPSNPN